ncbi:MAG: hypothetical protein ACI9S8_002802 [Chlamydiales bacterium]
MKSDSSITTYALDSRRSPSPPEERIEAEIVLLHKRESLLYPPILYQLPNGIMDPASPAESIRNAFFSHHNAFVPLGVISVLNKHLKHIVLSNGALIIYKYLIIVFNPDRDGFQRTQHKQFSSGVTALVDTLMLKDKISFSRVPWDSLSFDSLKESDFIKKGTGTNDSSSDNIMEVAHHKMKQLRNSNFHGYLHGGSVIIC